MNLPEKLSRMTAYEPVRGDYPVRLDANESFLETPPWLRDAVAAAVAQVPLHRYPDPTASGVRRLAARLYGVDAAHITAGSGSDELIALSMAALVPRGGRVLLTDPDFSMYRVYAGLYELDCFAVGKAGRRVEIDAVLAEAKRIQPHLIIFSNPCNPTGLGVTRPEALRLADGADCPVAVDEAYMDFWDQSLIGDLPGRDNLLILKTCSKAYGLAGLRLGFALAGPDITAALQKSRSPYNVSALTQAAGEAALSHPDYLADCAARLREAAAALYQALSALSARSNGAFRALPTETNFVLLETPNAPKIYESLRAQGILIRLLNNTLLRVTAGTPEEQRALLAGLEAEQYIRSQ
ncbi:MAG: histidinol-phosphate aminotransferase family protein [Oscillospiraceae bacterium]|jgi:histidinol-phosphate aminotransferase|nr:histidinol-phosphate aminotransferase family protein [Oscillospiraceae bacterium]